ncbi:MAG TPA: PIN domain-containing protein [Methylomirabilota bacterium]|nr:PIN domain-containing protein [Methylomirabilota bacterium]
MPRRAHRTASVDDVPSPLLVDSGAWIALFSARDQHHAEAEAMVRAAVHRRARLLTTNLILAEVHRLLLFRAGIQPAIHALARIEASPLVAIEFATATHHRRARAWLEKLPDQQISYTDAVSFAVMEVSRCRAAMSFDHDFEVAGFVRWRLGGRKH